MSYSKVAVPPVVTCLATLLQMEIVCGLPSLYTKLWAGGRFVLRKLNLWSLLYL